MKLLKLQTIICFSLILLSMPALAEGMKYTTLSEDKEKLKPQNMEIKSLNYKQEEKERLAIEAKTKEEKETMDKVWERYKALAAGVEKDKKPKLAEPAKPQKISLDKPDIPYAAGSSTQKKAKSLNILDQYEQIKSRRSQMKMITIKREEEE